MVILELIILTLCRTLERIPNKMVCMVKGSKTTNLHVVQCVPELTGKSCWTQNFEEKWAQLFLQMIDVIVWYQTRILIWLVNGAELD